MISVVEELLLAAGIYRGAFADLSFSAKHRDADRHELGLQMVVRDAIAYHWNREMPTGLISLNLEYFNKGQDKASGDFNSFLAAKIPKLFGDKKAECL